MNNIQKLISELEAGIFNADENIRQCGWSHNTYQKGYYDGQKKALNICIEKLTLLLNAETQDNGQKQA